MIVGGLEGAMLVARPYGDIARFQVAAANLLAGLTSAAGEPASTVKSPIQEILRRLEARNRVQAAVRATKERWV
jgi:hypothetical protein